MYILSSSCLIKANSMNILSKVKEVRRQDFIDAASVDNMKSNFTFLLLANVENLKKWNEN